MSDYQNQPKPEIQFSKSIRAGKRTYYFDVKSTRNNDFYLTITESKRVPGANDKQPNYEKHKLFLYKEDFEKFADGLLESIAFIKENTTPIAADRKATYETTDNSISIEKSNHDGAYTDVDFDDLEK